MLVNKEDHTLAEKLGTGTFLSKDTGTIFTLYIDKDGWNIVISSAGWKHILVCSVLNVLAPSAVRLPYGVADRVEMLELWQAKQEGQSKLGCCTPHSCCPSHAMQMELDLEEESPLEELFESLVGARQASKDEKVIMGYVAHEKDLLGVYKVMIEYIGEQPKDDE